MAVTNHERVGKALDLLKDGLVPFVERELKAQHAQKWFDEVKAAEVMGHGRGRSRRQRAARWRRRPPPRTITCGAAHTGTEGSQELAEGVPPGRRGRCPQHSEKASLTP
jgi:hypothetical protein